MELTGEIDKVTIVAVEFSTLVTVIDSQDRQKINKTIKSSSSTINSFDETGIYIFHSTMEAQILLLNLHGACIKTNHILSH